MTYSFHSSDWLALSEIEAPRPVGAAVALDFTSPFMPDALAHTAPIDSLSPGEQLRLNQIRGRAYLAIADVLDRAVPDARRDIAAGRAEALDLLARAFTAGFGARCEVIAPAPAAETLAVRSTLGRALVDLHLSCMTKRHVEAVALNERKLEPAFRRILLQRWIDGAPGRGRDLPSVGWTAAEAGMALSEYERFCGELGRVLAAQVGCDVAALERTCGRRLPIWVWQQILSVQRQAYWWTFVGAGQSHPRLADALARLRADATPAAA